MAKRLKLPVASRAECLLLDQQIPIAEARERAASRQALLPVQQELLGLRQRFIGLAC